MVTRATLLVGTVFAAVMLTNGSTLMAQDKKIQKKDLPAAVQKAMESEIAGATVKGFAKEVEDGKTFYEIETTKNGHARDLLYDASGTLAEVEEEVALDTLPAAVKSALSAAGGKLVKVETLTKGSTMVYEGHIEKGGKKSEVKVTPDGKPVTP
jgi:uncharacterized membrane protein YkoI